MRLTKKIKDKDMEIAYSFDLEQSRNTLSALIKLGQLEDIEDELGIDLITLFKGKTFEELFNEVWIKDIRTNKKGERIPYTHKARIYSYIKAKYLLVYSTDVCDCVNRYEIKDYGKTWALTKEELL